VMPAGLWWTPALIVNLQPQKVRWRKAKQSHGRFFFFFLLILYFIAK
jgi:hypothetical protein